MLEVATTVSARALSLEASSRPDTLKQTDQLIKQKTLADGVGHAFVLEVGDGAHRQAHQPLNDRLSIAAFEASTIAGTSMGGWPTNCRSIGSSAGSPGAAP